jgi:hypothetical protein
VKPPELKCVLAEHAGIDVSSLDPRLNQLRKKTDVQRLAAALKLPGLWMRIVILYMQTASSPRRGDQPQSRRDVEALRVLWKTIQWPPDPRPKAES